jgi:hypothetical protein
MKPAILLAIAIVMVSSLPLISRQDDAIAQESASASANAHANQSPAANANANAGGVEANGAAAADAQMQPVNAELVGKLDSKTAKAGDPVVAKTKEKVHTADGTEIPKGARLVGHVASAQAHDAEHADSSMSLVFDRAEWKGGQSIPIHSAIQSVSAPTSAETAMSADDAFAAPPGGMGGGIHAGGGGHSGGGLVGGAVNSAGSTTGGVGSNVGSNLASGANGLAHTSSDVAGGASGALNGDVRSAAATSGSLGARATGLSGVMLAGDASGSTAGTLSAAKHNVHLDSGTQIVLGLSAVAPSK